MTQDIPIRAPEFTITNPQTTEIELEQKYTVLLIQLHGTKTIISEL